MTVALTHTTVATGTDAGNAQIGKTQWNETHTLSMATGFLLGRTTAGAGAVEEITASTGLTLTAGALAVAKAFPTGDIVGTTDTQNLSNKTFTDNPTFSAGTANGVLYLNGSKVLTSGSDLSFDGTALSLTGSAATPLQVYKYAASGSAIVGQYTASGTASSPTTVGNGRVIGRNDFYGHDGTSFVNAVRINASVDGAVSTGVVYGKVSIVTRGADGLQDRLTVNSTGTVNVSALTASKAVFTDASKNLTSTGTLGVDQGGTGLTAGTSGGVLYYSATGTLASSAALAASALVVGGGAGVAPSTITTGTGVTTALGVNTGSSGAFVVNGGALGTPSSGTVTNLTGTASININGTVGATTANTGAFTSITSTSASGILTRAAATQDGVHIYGRAGGTGNFEVIITPTTLSADRTLTLPDNSGTVLTTGTAVTAAQGGTGQTSYAVGDILYASAATTLSKLAGVATGNALISGGVTTAPSWGKIGLTTHISGTLAVGNGGTGATTLTGILKGNGTSAFSVVVSGTDIKTVNGASLLGSGNIDVGGAVNGILKVNGAASYSAAVAGTDYVAPGTATTFTATQNFAASGITLKGSSTGTTTFASANASATNYTITFPASTGTVLTTATAVTVAQGGTGATTLTGVLKGNGTSAFTAATAGTDYAAPGSTTTYTVVQNFAASGITLKGSSTGTTTFASANASATNYTITFPASTGTILTTAAAVTVAQGGTGATTLTGILKGNGTSAFTAATAGTDYVIPSGDVASVNGYKCYGGVGTANASGDLVVTFPAAFAATSTTGVAATSTSGNYCVITAISTTSVTIQAQSRSAGTGVASAAIRWVAVGL